jgi:hypothetical protein
MRRALLAGSAALVVTGGLGLKASSPTTPPEALLGAPVATALEVLRKQDPTAFLAELCRGNQGVVAAIRHLGIDWQVAAHSDGNNVTQVALFSSSPGAIDREVCRQSFKTSVVPYLRGHHPEWPVKVYEKDFGATGFNLVMRGTLADGTLLGAYAQRFDATGGLCLMSVSYERPEPAATATPAPSTRSIFAAR